VGRGYWYWALATMFFCVTRRFRAAFAVSDAAGVLRCSRLQPLPASPLGRRGKERCL